MRFRTWAPLPLFGWPQVALIPLVNVVILLLGFLTLQSSLFVPAGLSLQLPKAVTAEAVGGAGGVITVTDQRLIYVNGQLTGSASHPDRADQGRCPNADRRHCPHLGFVPSARRIPDRHGDHQAVLMNAS